MPILCSARMPDSLERIPVREKSSIPLTRKAFQPSSRSVVFSGVSSVLQTRDISSSVFPMKKKPAAVLISAISLTLHTVSL